MSAREQLLAGPATCEGVQQVLCARVTEAVQRQFGQNIRALVLTGSLARDEGSFLRIGERWRLLGDAEFLLILHDGAALVSDHDFRATAQAVEQRLGQQGIECRIDLSAAHREYLRRMRPHIFAYELRACGKVLWGEPATLSAIPSFAARDIPKEDAWWLLCNRIIEQLTWLAELHAGAADANLYGIQKFYLELATSLLVFLDEYEPGYGGRASKLTELARRADVDAPFPLQEFATLVAQYTEFKLRPEAGPGASATSEESLIREWLKPIPYARKLWQWEVRRLLGERGLEDSTEVLAAGLLRQQKVSDKIRGWLSVLRAPDARVNAATIATLARRWLAGTPRYLTYAAASQLYFAMPEILAEGANEEHAALASVRSLLPLLPSEHAARGWAGLCRAVTWNYEQFLTRTRLT